MTQLLGKGFAYLSIANFSFFLASYLVYFGLARVLPIEEFGIYSLVISVAATVNIIFVDGVQQSVSRFVSYYPAAAEVIKRKMFLFLSALGLALFASFFLFAEHIALFFNDKSLAPYIQLIGLLLISHPLYALFMGFFNGLRSFKAQAKLKICYSAMKVAFIVGLALATGSVFGAVLGFIAASFAAVLLGLLASKGFGSAGKFPVSGLLRFAVPLSLFALSINILTSMDLFALKILSLQAVSNLQVAYYTTASTISKLPYFAIMAFGMVLFPTISGFSRTKEIEKIRRHIAGANRYAFMLLMPIVLPVAATARHIITFLYPEAYLPGAEPLSILIFGLGFFSIFYMLSAVVSGYGKPLLPMAIAFAALVIDFLCNLFLIPLFGLRGAALASLMAMSFAFAAISLAVILLFRVFMPFKSFARILFSALVASLAISYIILPGMLLPLSYLIAFAIYVCLLFVLHELTANDIAFFKAIMPRRGSSG